MQAGRRLYLCQSNKQERKTKKLFIFDFDYGFIVDTLLTKCKNTQMEPFELDS